MSTPKNPLEQLLRAFLEDKRVAVAQEDVKRTELALQSARVEQLNRAIERIEAHIAKGEREASEKMALEQQRALQNVSGGPHLGQGFPGGMR